MGSNQAGTAASWLLNLPKNVLGRDGLVLCRGCRHNMVVGTTWLWGGGCPPLLGAAAHRDGAVDPWSSGTGTGRSLQDGCWPSPRSSPWFLQENAASCDPARHAPPAPPRPTAPPASGWAAGRPRSQVRGGAQPWWGELQASHNPRCPQPALTPRLQTNAGRLRSPVDLSNPAQHPRVRGPGCFPQSRSTSPGPARFHPPALSLWGFGAPSSQPQ